MQKMYLQHVGKNKPSFHPIYCSQLRLMIKINTNQKASDLNKKLKKFWEGSAEKISLIQKTYDETRGSPVFTINGTYTTRGWTEWTQGFQYGSAILQYDATGEKSFLELGREKTVKVMAPHVSHTGVH